MTKFAMLILAALAAAAAAASAVSPAASAVQATDLLRSLVPNLDRRLALVRSRRQGPMNVTIGNATYTDYASCVTASGQAVAQLRTMMNAFAQMNSTMINATQLAEMNSMLASMDTCPVGLSAFQCLPISESCAGVEVTPPNSSMTSSQVASAMTSICSASSTSCLSYTYSLMATIAANPTACAFAHQYEAESSDSCGSVSATAGPKVGDDNVTVANGDTACISCTGSNVIRITDVFFGQRNAAGHATCESQLAEDELENHCDGKATCSFTRSTSGYSSSNVGEAAIPAANGGAPCLNTDSGTVYEVEFTCVTPATLSEISDPQRIQAMGASISEFMCVQDNNGDYCGTWNYEHLHTGEFRNVSYHDGHMSAGQCQLIRDSGSCCWASFIDDLAASQPSGDAASIARNRAIYDTAVSSCATHGIPIATILGNWDTQNEHCGTAASAAAGTGGTGAANSINVDSDVGNSGSGALSSSMLLAVVLAFMSSVSM